MGSQASEILRATLGDKASDSHEAVQLSPHVEPNDKSMDTHDGSVENSSHEDSPATTLSNRVQELLSDRSFRLKQIHDKSSEFSENDRLESSLHFAPPAIAFGANFSKLGLAGGVVAGLISVTQASAALSNEREAKALKSEFLGTQLSETEIASIEESCRPTAASLVSSYGLSMLGTAIGGYVSFKHSRILGAAFGAYAGLDYGHQIVKARQSQCEVDTLSSTILSK